MPTLDKNLILKRCPHCRVDNPNLVERARFQTMTYSNNNPRNWAAYACQRCGGVVTASSKVNTTGVADIFPTPISLDDSIPLRAKIYLDQAIDSIHAPAGSIMLAGSSVDAMLKEKGYKDGSLYSRINKAVSDHLITKEMADWAHEVRLGANGQRHADDDLPLPSEKDAQSAIDFTMALSQFLFIMPSRINKGIKDAKPDLEQKAET